MDPLSIHWIGGSEDLARTTGPPPNINLYRYIPASLKHLVVTGLMNRLLVSNDCGIRVRSGRLQPFVGAIDYFGQNERYVCSRLFRNCMRLSLRHLRCRAGGGWSSRVV